MPTQGHYKSVTTSLREGVGDQGPLDPLSSASVSSNKGWQCLPPGTLAILARPIGLMVTQTTEVNKNKGGITERCQSRVISKLKNSL